MARRVRKRPRPKTPKRYDWLIQMINHNGYTLGAEIGVARGNTTVKLLRHCPELFLFAVDKWTNELKPEAGAMGDLRYWSPIQVRKEFVSNTRSCQNRIHLLEGDSVKMANRVSDNSLDFVFIDADHRYEAVKADIIAWTPKVRDGGIVCGHDVNAPGVIQAIRELISFWEEPNVDQVWFANKEDVSII